MATSDSRPAELGDCESDSYLSLWEVGGIIVVYVVAVREATWMAKKIKQRFPEIKEPLDSISADRSI